MANGTYTKKTVTYREGEEQVTLDYFAEVETVLELKRTFTQTGQFYHVVLESQNMYNELDRVEMEWEVRAHMHQIALLSVRMVKKRQ